ncbi:MAG TPA: glycine--tRNA ligase [Candidatus Limnocylindria bacterium]|nr:glycine--tRNA ligase [Candidatus Limnocylindria bacterium]
MSEPKANELMEKIVSLCKGRGFVFQSSDIYGGINGFWDYGPLGAELKRNVKELWWREMVRFRDDVVGLEATIIMHPQIWRASGHVDTFADLMRECPLTKKRVRADQVDPQTGIAYAFTGATSTENGASSEEAIEVLIPIGKPRESAEKIARQFYEMRGIKQPTLQGGAEGKKLEESTDFHPESGVHLTAPRPFNLMFKTYVGPVADEENVAYLRPETAQAIFAQFKNVLATSRQKVPFGIAQMGKAFRNEVTPRNFTFRSREFEQMELEFFIKPDEAVAAQAGTLATVESDAWKGEPDATWGWEVWHKYWVEQRVRFYESIGLPRTSLVEYWQKADELAHYARATVDLLFKFPFGTQELEGIAARGDFDLTQHQKHSGKGMEVFDEELRAAWGKLTDDRKAELRKQFIASKIDGFRKKGMADAEAATQAESEATAYFEKLAKGNFVPHVIEPSAGVDRLILALLCHAYSEVTDTDEKGKTETRVVMRFHPKVAPIKVGIFPLLKNRPELVKKAKEVRDLLRPHLPVFYDETGAVGRRYARQDEAGTPYCITVDFDTLGEKPEHKDTVTVRDRDTRAQERIPIQDLLGWLQAKLR